VKFPFGETAEVLTADRAGALYQQVSGLKKAHL
jgi:hypothetical protein